MRSTAVVTTCLAFLLAFVVSPFAHVHTGSGGHADHDHAGLIHAHFYNFSNRSHDAHPHAATDRPEFPAPAIDTADDDDDDHAAVGSIDIFTLALISAPALYFAPSGPVLLFIPTQTFHPVAIVEECGHDPPCLDRSNPRAPPA